MSDQDEPTFSEEELEALARLQGKPVSPALQKRVLDAVEKEKDSADQSPSAPEPEI